MESRKRVRMNLFVGQQWKHGQRGQTCGHGEWNKWREQRGHMYISVCKTDSQGDLLYDSGGHTSAVTTYRDGVGGERQAQGAGDIHHG